MKFKLILIFTFILSLLGSNAYAQLDTKTKTTQMSVGTNFVSDFCLEVNGNNSLVIAKCSGKPEQNLSFSDLDHGQLLHKGKCVDVARRGEPLLLKECQKLESQDWGFNENGTMSNLKDDCVDILNFKSDVGTPVIAWECTATENQKFFPKRVTLVTNDLSKMGANAAEINIIGTPIIASYFAQGQCLEATLNGTIIINNCDTSNNQKLKFANGNSGQITNGSKCLASNNKGSPLVLKTCNNSADQNWSFRNNGTLGNGSSICADIFAFLTKPGTNVIAWDCTSTDNQIFYPAVAVDSGMINLGSAYATVLRSNEGTTTISINPEYSFANMTGSGGIKLSASDKGEIKGGNNGVIVFGGAGVLTTRFLKGLSSSSVKDAKIGSVNLSPSDWSFFSKETAGSFKLIK